MTSEYCLLPPARETCQIQKTVASEHLKDLELVFEPVCFCFCLRVVSVRGVVSLFHSGILFYAMDCFRRYLTHAQTCDNIRVQSASQWIASVRIWHTLKPVITFVFKVLCNGLPRSILDTCSNLWSLSCSKCYAMDCLGPYLTHVQTCANTAVPNLAKENTMAYLRKKDAWEKWTGKMATQTPPKRRLYINKTTKKKTLNFQSLRKDIGFMKYGVYQLKKKKTFAPLEIAWCRHWFDFPTSTKHCTGVKSVNQLSKEIMLPPPAVSHPEGCFWTQWNRWCCCCCCLLRLWWTSRGPSGTGLSHTKPHMLPCTNVAMSHACACSSFA